MARRAVVNFLRLLLRPFGYLAFVVALAALSGAAKLLGEQHELGFFSGRLSRTVWNYPEVTRRGVQVAWLVWVLALVIAITPLDPLSTRWDEVGLVALAVTVLWHRLGDARRGES